MQNLNFGQWLVCINSYIFKKSYIFGLIEMPFPVVLLCGRSPMNQWQVRLLQSLKNIHASELRWMVLQSI